MFSNGPSINAARSGHTATTLGDGRVVVIGGDASGSIEVNDRHTASVVCSRRLSAAEQIGAARLANGNILIVGGTAPDGCNVQIDQILNISAGLCIGRRQLTMADSIIQPNCQELRVEGMLP
jgi:hypothetical protein